MSDNTCKNLGSSLFQRDSHCVVHPSDVKLNGRRRLTLSKLALHAAAFPTPVSEHVALGMAVGQERCETNGQMNEVSGAVLTMGGSKEGWV